MPFKNLLVHLDDSAPCAGRLEAAIDLALAHGAHLTGLYVIAEPELPGSVLGLLPPSTLAEHRRAREDLARQAATRFAQATARPGLVADCRTERCAEVHVPATLALHARYSDLTVLGQPEPGNGIPGARRIVEDCIFGSGRPVLVAPFIGAQPTLGQRVMVAWDASREATRAVNDALPILERAAAVEVAVINPDARAFGHGAQPGADIALHLARHGVKVTATHTEARDIAVGEALLSLLADRGCDMLVTGAYGHSRFAEFLLGGVTRLLLNSMTVPVLMSH